MIHPPELYIVLIVIYLLSFFIGRYIFRLNAKYQKVEKGDGLQIFYILPMFNTVGILLGVLQLIWLRRKSIIAWIICSDLYKKEKEETKEELN